MYILLQIDGIKQLLESLSNQNIVAFVAISLCTGRSINYKLIQPELQLVDWYWFEPKKGNRIGEI